MPNWKTHTAGFDALKAGSLYSKRAVAEVIGVPPPTGPRDWGGLVRFQNGFLVFITLEKGIDRYAQRHRYADRFDAELLYWDSRASHTKHSSQVVALADSTTNVAAFARKGEKTESGRTAPFIYLGMLGFIDWWGDRPVHFTWRLRDFPDGIGGTSELDALAHWEPTITPSPARHETSVAGPEHGSSAGISPEGARRRVLVNRYERDPRARLECLKHHGVRCLVCGFDFAAIYGPLGAGFIFVHHRIPITRRARQGEYELDPVRDLMPICGNCHAVVHRRGSNGDDAPSTSMAHGLGEDGMKVLLALRRLASDAPWEGTDW